ncbi:MAG: DivIVA domain-containing protein [Actinomycetota bacterium]|nr:DivIVA domain-containing protein [Actinomycetota bacterium]
MTSPGFSRVGRLRSGYDPRQVDAFLASSATAGSIRRVGFTVVRNGYDPYAVDAALDELEQQAAARALGEETPRAAEAASLLALLGRSDGTRFPRASRLLRGYSVPHVDGFCAAVAPTVQGGEGPGLREVRDVVFPPRRGGYVEDDVDALLDRVIDVLLLR